MVSTKQTTVLLDYCCMQYQYLLLLALLMLFVQQQQLVYAAYRRCGNEGLAREDIVYRLDNIDNYYINTK